MCPLKNKFVLKTGSPSGTMCVNGTKPIPKLTMHATLWQIPSFCPLVHPV